jgi:hypothetical protein
MVLMIEAESFANVAEWLTALTIKECLSYIFSMGNRMPLGRR